MSIRALPPSFPYAMVLNNKIFAREEKCGDFRVTIPKEVRELLELKQGDDVVFFTVEGWKGRVCFRKSGRRMD